MEGKEIIHIKNAYVRRDGEYILSGVDLDVQEGGHIAVIGPNGAGKSTLLEVIARNIYPLALDEYENRIFGRSRFLQSDLRKMIGVVSDRNSMFLDSTYKARDIVCSGLYASLGFDFHHRIEDSDWVLADEELKKVGMYEKRYRMMKTLSSGEKRRIMLARAEITRPRLLLLDEASNALDFPLRRDLRDTIRKYASEETIIMVTHELSEIIPEIDRVILMKDGHIVLDGPKQEVLTEDNLSMLYGMKVYLSERDGIYSAYC